MSGFWRKCRIAFRWARYACWLLAVLALLALAWVNVIGVPQFFQTRIVAALREPGVPVEISRIRWRFIRGVVADNVIIGDRSNREAKPLFTAGQIQLRFDYGALLKKQFHLTGVVVRDGIFTLPVNATNHLTLLNVQAEVRFLPDDTWSLDELRADFSGAKILLAGQVVHAPDAKNWDLFAAKKTGGHGALANPLQELADTLAKIHFTRPPQINAQIYGDARDVHSFTLRLNADVPQVVTPWFAARGLQLAANAAMPASAPANADPTLDFWTNALPFRLAWTTRAAQLDAQKISAQKAECAGSWDAARLTVNRLSANIGGGDLDTAGSLDVATRDLLFTNRSALELHDLLPLLPEKVAAEILEMRWTQPPALAVEGSLTLPAWTNRAPDWNAALVETARLHGTFAATNAVARGRAVELARAEFFYADKMWRVPQFEVAQGRTHVSADGEFSLASENFRGQARGALDVDSVHPFLPTNIQHIVDVYFHAHEPVHLHAEFGGRGGEVDALWAAGGIAVTNFSVREQAYESAAAKVSFTNRALMFLRPESWRAGGTQRMTADSVTLDFGARMIFFTNGFGTTDPMAVVRAIGPKTAHYVEPYEFLSPPTVRVHGQLPLRDLNRGTDFDGTEMDFEIVKGAPFRWTKLRSASAKGTVRWLGQFLVVTNVTADFYDGQAAGWAYFDFRPSGYGCDFKFAAAVTNVDARLAGGDLTTNRSSLIEGRLTGNVEVTEANSGTWRSWNGHGAARLRDGLLWSIPVFGFASPVLDTIAPGLGNNRATDASATFMMTNGVARSDDLVIHTLTMQLDYKGAVNLQGEVNARVTAQLLRNTPMLGEFISTVLWPVSKIFECQVDGKITDPKVTPIYFPFSKYLLNPVRSLEQMLPSEKPRG
jgi:hypothetical protein